MEFDAAGVGGLTVATLRAQIDADLASASRRPGSTYSYALITIGANDVAALPAEAAWNANLAYVLDAIHAWAPQARVGVALPGRQGFDAECATLAARIRTVLATRSWAFEGPDEQVYLKGADNYVTNTTDGVHPTTAFYDSGVAPAWWAVMPR
jgi:lysophospholipase L1-like esterase